MTNYTDDPFVTIPTAELANVGGGINFNAPTNLQEIFTTAKNAARSAYRWGVREITADAGAWKLANQMYGTPGHGSTWDEKLRARTTLKNLLNSVDRLPTWAPNW